MTDPDALRRGDEVAWRAFHEREFPDLFRFAAGYAGDPDLAEDSVSESFVRLAQELRHRAFADAPAMRRWLFVVCRNLVRDGLRRRATAHLDEARAVAARDEEAGVIDRLALTKALGTLPEAQREVLVLRFVVGLPTHDVAAMSGRGVKAVESLQHRALVALRRAVALEGYAP